MACEFAVLLNPGPTQQIDSASQALDLVHELEDQLSVFRPESELSCLNRQAFKEPVRVERQMFRLLLLARQLAIDTEGAFDPTSGPLIELWRQCRSEGRIPAGLEIAECLEQIGIENVEFDETTESLSFKRERVELNLGGIGKGYALDRMGESLIERGCDQWLLHGGHSSLLARGEHETAGGWPVGIRNPLFPKQRLATVLLKNQSLSSSGSGVQHFRHAGKRYGHILDPRTGWPVEEMLSVNVLAPTAAQADALSTAFFVLGVENARQYCDNHKEVAALLVPPPCRGRTLEPINCGIPESCLHFVADGDPTET